MKILVTPRSFGKTDPGLFTRLKDAGLEIIRNETGAILDEAAIIELLRPCEGVIIGVDPLNKKVLEQAPNLRAISKYGVGLDNIDLEECARRGIKVSRATGSNSEAVADYAFALMLGVCRRVCYIDRRCRANDWSKVTSLDMFGKTLGIIGLGAIGKCVARRAKGFEMRIMAADEKWDENFAAEHNIIRSDVDSICAKADFITLHCDLNDSTRNLINRNRIANMKETAILINTARGGLMDEESVLKALSDNRIYGAGIDVFEHEPPKNPEWRKLDNVILGSHCSASTKGAVEMMGAISVDNLLRDLDLKF